MNLKVIQLKPNPSGKDVSFLGPSPSQLGGEWVDLRNDATVDIEMGHVRLYHRAYVGVSSEWKWAEVIANDAAVSGVLHPGQTLRVHSGRVRGTDVIRFGDLAGADMHVFTGRDSYIWNNYQADTAAIWNPQRQVFIDQAEYAAQPPEGVVLVRSGNLLIPGFGSTLGSLAALAGLGGCR